MKKKTGRNDPCFCGSGKKFKKCCLPNQLFPASPPSGKEEGLSAVNSKKLKPAKSRFSILRGKHVSITGEAEYIIGRAMDCDSRVVSLGALVFFSTQTGDVWMLDAKDQLALCLARGGKAQPFSIKETNADFKIEWTVGYQIKGDKFIVRQRFGKTSVISGYPTPEIMQAVERAR